MPNEFEELPPEIRAAFDHYPRPTANAEFDARFWRELDNRRHRYRGMSGVLRRLIEVEIEGIAVWRLGVALFSVPMICALGVALLNLGNAPIVPVQSAPQFAEMQTMMPRYARELWDIRDYEYRAPKPATEKPKAKEEISCVSFDRDLA